MPFNLFRARSQGGDSPSSYSPFQAIVSTVQSGIDAGNFNGKCPCDDSSVNYTSSYFFSAGYPRVTSSGELAVSIYSGSMLYSQYSMASAGYTGIKSFVGDKPQDFTNIDGCAEKKLPVMRIYGLNKPIFLKTWFANVPGNPGVSRTLKIWLSVCFPTGIEESTQDDFNDSVDQLGVTCVDCTERANVPLTAFIGCGVLDWPKVAVSKLVDKGTSQKPRLEKRQVAANIPIAEIDYKGTVLKQYLNANLCLTDCCVQGVGVKLPLSVFSEFG